MKNILITISIFLIFTFMFVESTGTDNIDIGDIKDPDLKFVVVGDPHIKAIIDNDTGAERLKYIIDTVNKMDIDFIVFMGDITDKGTRTQYQLSKDILSNLKKPYYVIIGNHDLMTNDNMFKEYYGNSEKIENIKGRNTGTIYQLLFVSTYGDRNESGNLTNLYWSFDFSKANKTIPTLIFSHSPVRCPSSEYILCKLNEEKLVYGKSMESKLDGLNLLGIYSGHIHRDSNEIRDNVRYVTVNGLVSIGIAEIYAQASDKIGYSAIKDGKLYYQLIDYDNVIDNKNEI